MKRLQVNIWDKYGRLTIKSELPTYRQPCWAVRRKFVCSCDCWKESCVPLGHLSSMHTTSCGCLEYDNKTIHWQSKRWNIKPEYYTWMAISQRCYNPNVSWTKNYLWKWIVVSDEWRNSFEQFYKDMWPRPSKKHSIDRINTNWNYCKENCRWATKKEQSRNTSRNVFIEYNGERRTIIEWSEKTWIKYSTLRWRIGRWLKASSLFLTKNLC